MKRKGTSEMHESLIYQVLVVVWQILFVLETCQNRCEEIPGWSQTWISHNLVYNKLNKNIIAKLSQSSSSSWAELALFPADPTTHPQKQAGS